MRHYSAKYGVSEFPGEGISFSKLTMDTMNDSSGAEIKVWDNKLPLSVQNSTKKYLSSYLLLLSDGSSAGQQELILRA